MASRIAATAEAVGDAVQTAVLSNLPPLPDTLLAGTALFALLLQSLPLAALAVALVALGPVHGAVARALASAMPGLAGGVGGGVDRCSGRFAGVSLERLARAATVLNLAPIATDSWPSYYATFFGFLAAYVGLVPATFAQELSEPAAQGRAAAIYAGLGILGLLLVLVLAYRWASECDSVGGLAAGLLLGGVLGAATHAALAVASGRSLVNILGTPLLTSRVADGAPLYICKSSAE